MILLQLSSGSGPAECCLAVAKAADRLRREAAALAVDVSIVESEPGPEPGTWHSLLLSLSGEEAAPLAASWCGSLLWVCPSPYRPGHRRKNWFIAGARVTPPEALPTSEIRFETLRSSGPGGQHVNTTNSAVRATHLASGISVRVQSERSQHANKRLAVVLIQRRLDEIAQRRAGEQRSKLRDLHQALERGNPVRRFVGPGFEPSR
jgi:peptide chain release factor